MASIINMCSRYWNTLRYLKLIQIFARVRFFFPTSNVSQNKKNQKSHPLNSWVKSPKSKQSMFSLNTFEFLNEEHNISKNDWNSSKYSKLWLYNLHYFDDLNSIESEKRVEWHNSFIDHWIKENLPFQGIGWEPYPSSLRVVNWVKWSLNENILKDHWLLSLEIQVRFLFKNIEYHLLGNHIIANAKALMFAGLFFHGEEANIWYKKGRKLLEKELSEQVLPDGGNFELSTMYHSIFLEDMLDLVNIHRVYGHKIPRGLEEKIPLMFKWLKAMIHPDGEISFFNDASFGIAPTFDELKKYAIRLNLVKFQSDKKRLTILENSSYARVEIDDLVAIIDRSSVGPDYLPAHAHADTLSFEMSLYGQRLIVNSGTSVYGESKERHRQRGTDSHSTVMLDSENSSEIWSGFRVAKRAKILKSFESDDGDKITLSASHNGYHRLKGKPTHFRQWEFTKGSLRLEDLLTGEGIHNADVIFPLHPSVKIINTEANEVLLEVSNKKISIKFEVNGDLRIIKSTFHPEFGLSVNNHKIHYQLSQTLPIKIITRITW